MLSEEAFSSNARFSSSSASTTLVSYSSLELKGKQAEQSWKYEQKRAKIWVQSKVKAKRDMSKVFLQKSRGNRSYFALFHRYFLG